MIGVDWLGQQQSATAGHEATVHLQSIEFVGTGVPRCVQAGSQAEHLIIDRQADSGKMFRLVASRNNSPESTAPDS